MADKRLSTTGKLNMLSIIEDPKKAEELLEKRWNYFDMERMLYERL